MSEGTVKAVIASRIFTPEPAAASFRLRALAREIVSRGGTVDVLTTTAPSAVPDTLSEPGITVRRAPVLRDSEGYVRGYAQYMSFDIPLFFRLLVMKRPDVIICEPPPTTGFFTRIAAAIRRIPYVYYAADIWSDAADSSAPKPVVKLLRFVETWAMRGATEVITVSDAVADRLRQLGVAHITVATNGIDTDVFTLEGPEADPRPGVRYFVYAGTASEWQGADVFAKAMKIVHREEPDVKLCYLGQGSSSQTIAQIAQEMPEGVVTQIGRVAQAEAAAWQRHAAGALVSIKPGLGYDFAMPTKVYSALSTGTPVVYAGPGPLRGPIASANLGEVVDYDADAVAAAMLAVVRAPRDTRERVRLRQWVIDHHSLAATARAAYGGVEKAMR
ncbi:glycosyltransferase family 4 protein [Trueperella pecoris]|uniref:Glycosyltransferase family 4 protein n=1 Tax=Trueperella pecoris TaxID=2733571 RepID=A0A7M1QTR4_9ACTO|nr:glycosyltransferase family 4 protein [Trueperella pecoris]QOQ38313.1 glycosyltransferase family 4 protein [Trueperella pecoris]QOR45201.1 glycosyltransferase family 4 protein [Trueperella pecoris]QTG75105.1 glycosyltransferase family 4 protein [Trueperella pecoris]